uniref:C-C motif chemokine ligand 16 n=1 Tax=Myotis myotis TaxID=51298 RepID=A0A7J7T449_MYOMY|nr:C-C motif chemokine ligand 16 [Myotis myotis]
MKVFVAVLFLLLLSLSTASASASYSQARSPMSVNISPSCCLKHEEKVLPRNLVTKKKREICTNPNNKWVQDYIKDPNLPLLPPRKLPQVKSI